MNKFKDERRKLRKEKTWTGFSYTVFGTTLPFFLSLLGILLISKSGEIISFLDDGQVLLFSVGLLTSSFYIFRDEDNLKTLRKSKHKLNILINHFILIFLLFCSVIYAILYTINISESILEINILFVRWSSIIAFIFALRATYISINIDLYKIYPPIDVQKESQHEVKNIMDEL